MGSPPPSRTLLLARVAVSLASARIFRLVEPPDQKPAQSSAEDRLLLFWAVGSGPEAMRLVSQNIAHARRFEAGRPGVARPLAIDNYLVHYDLNRSGWEAAMGRDWYGENVKYSAELTGVKMWLAKDLLLSNYGRRNSSFYNPVDPQDIATAESLEAAKNAAKNATNASQALAALLEGHLENGTKALDNISVALLHGGIGALGEEELARLPAVDLATYEYAWLLDEDVLFSSSLDLRRMVDRARESNANILSPSILFEGESGDPRRARLEEMANMTNETNWTRPPPRVWGALPPWEPPPRKKRPSNEHADERSEGQSDEQHCHWVALIDSNSTAYEECMARRAERWRRRHDSSAVMAKRRAEQMREERKRLAEERRRKKYAPLYPGDLEVPAMYEAEGTGRDLYGEGLGCQREDTLCDLQAPVPSCEYRYTNFVEVSFPLVKPSAFRKVLGDCPFCLKHRGSIWGLDRVWCSMSADSWEAANSSCAILDQFPVVHLNHRTLPKWKQDYRLAMSNYNWGVFYDVMDRGGKFWAQDAMALFCHNSSTSVA